MPTPPIDPARLRAAALGRRTELYRYMLDNYVKLSRAIEKAAGKTDWNAIGAEIQAQGVKVGKGSKKGPSWAVRTTWAKVCADVAARNPKRTSSPKAKQPALGIVWEVAPPADPMRRQALTTLEPEPYAKGPKLFDRSKWKPVRMKNQTTSKPEEKQ